MKPKFSDLFMLLCLVIFCFFISILDYKISGGHFKTIEPITWESVFHDYKIDIIAEGSCLSVVAILYYWYMKRK